MFQFTLPRGERRPGGSSSRRRPCFNSRSRVGSDLARGRFTIHDSRFNSRSRVGSDNQYLSVGVYISSFNSRSRVGSDFESLPVLNGSFIVSIHAPAWGATSDYRT